MDLRTKAVGTGLEKIELLKNAVHCYIKWKDEIKLIIGSDPKFKKVVAYAVNGKDEVLEAFEELPGSSAEIREKNKDRMAKKDKFEDACGAFIYQCLSRIHPTFQRELRDYENFDDIVVDSKAREFWELLEQVIMEEGDRGPERYHLRNYFDRIRQDKNESISDYATRFMDVIRQFELLNEEIPESGQNQRFLNGMHPKYSRIREKILDDDDNHKKSVSELAKIAETKWKNQRKVFDRQKMFTPRTQPEVVAAMQQEKTFKRGQRTFGQPDKRSKIQCWKCGKEGHVQKECTSQEVEKHVSFPKSNPTSKAYIDTLANVSLTGDIDQLDNIKKVDGRFTNANGTIQDYDYEGVHPLLGRTIYLEDALMDIASFKNLRKNYKPIFIDEDDLWEFQNRRTQHVDLIAKGEDGLYRITPVNKDEEVLNLVAALKTDAVEKQLFELHRRLLHTNHRNLGDALRQGHYQDVFAGEFKSMDLQSVQQCITCSISKDGRLPGLERGKEYKARRPSVEEDEQTSTVPRYDLKERVDVDTFVDLVFFGSDISVTMLVKPHNYSLHRWITSKSKQDVQSSIVFLVNKVRSCNGVGRVISINFDREKSATAAEEEIVNQLTVLLRQTVPYKHERNVERFVRTARNRFRCILQELKDMDIPLTRTLRRLAWAHVIRASNFILNDNSGKFIPFQVQMGTEQYRTPPRFGEFVIASIGKVDDKEQPRNQVGMIVGFEELTRAVMVKFPGQSKEVMRDSYRSIPDDEGYRRYMERSQDFEDEMEEDEPSDVEIGFLNHTEIQELVDDHGFELGEGGSELPFETIQTPEPTILEDDEATATETRPRRSDRTPKPNRLPDFVYAILDEEDKKHLACLEHIHGLVEEAKIQGERGQRAAAKIELERVWKKYEAIRPVKLEDKSTAREIIKGRLFTVEKKDASHNFTKNKGRLVARGDMRKEKPTSVHDVFSPTVAFPTVLTLFNIILSKGYAWMVVDVESAYLNSKYEDGIYMKLDPNVAELMVELDNGVKEYVEPDGSIHVKIEKALYGLQESAKLWYETLGKTLQSFGLKRSNYDFALYYAKIDGEMLLVLVYVDDMLIAGQEAAIRGIKEKFESVFSINSSEMSPHEFDYVGIKVQYDSEDQAFLLSQPGIIKKITEGMEGGSDLPCDANLFQETDETPYEDTTEYRSKLMECNYLAKTRYDIKVALGYLATKSQTPTRGDRDKLRKLQQYLKQTQDIKLRIKPESGLQVYASADASFGTFKDGKSNTGAAIIVGFPNAPVLAKAIKQKSVANSSTTAELIAFSTAMEEILWLVELLNELEVIQGAVLVEQDNQSTIRLIEKGPSSGGRTKWINVKQFWVSEHLNKGDIKLKYVPSLDLLADGLTKPLGRKAFYRWRARILNFKIA